MNNQDIIIIILIFAVIYLMFKKNTKENFDVNDDIKQAINDIFDVNDDIKQAINDIYKADINAIRNLSNFANEIKNNNDSFTIPAKTTTLTDLNVTGNIVQFKGLIVIWSGTIVDIPKGWALCDGNKYKLDSNNIAIIDNTGVQTPDLRGRFVLGSGQGNTLTNRNINDIGGEETVTLTIPEMPSHNHKINETPATNCFQGGVCSGNRYLVFKEEQTTTNEGNGQPHNNMPPFYVLTYIMKL